MPATQAVPAQQSRPAGPRPPAPAPLPAIASPTAQDWDRFGLAGGGAGASLGVGRSHSNSVAGPFPPGARPGFRPGSVPNLGKEENSVRLCIHDSASQGTSCVCGGVDVGVHEHDRRLRAPSPPSLPPPRREGVRECVAESRRRAMWHLFVCLCLLRCGDDECLQLIVPCRRWFAAPICVFVLVALWTR